METTRIANADLRFSRIGLGTWAMGGWMWGGTDEQESIRTIHSAIDRGITLIDTAPVYGFGRSEEIVGKALAAGGLRRRVVIATKVGLDWSNGEPFRNATRARIFAEIEASLKRLKTDVIDIYQVHWPDPMIPIAETADAMATLFKQGKIREAIQQWEVAVSGWKAAAPGDQDPVELAKVTKKLDAAKVKVTEKAR